MAIPVATLALVSAWYRRKGAALPRLYIGVSIVCFLGPLFLPQCLCAVPREKFLAEAAELLVFTQVVYSCTASVLSYLKWSAAHPLDKDFR